MLFFILLSNTSKPSDTFPCSNQCVTFDILSGFSSVCFCNRNSVEILYSDSWSFIKSFSILILNIKYKKHYFQFKENKTSCNGGSVGMYHCRFLLYDFVNISRLNKTNGNSFSTLQSNNVRLRWNLQPIYPRHFGKWKCVIQNLLSGFY